MRPLIKVADVVYLLKTGMREKKIADTIGVSKSEISMFIKYNHIKVIRKPASPMFNVFGEYKLKMSEKERDYIYDGRIYDNILK